MFLFGLAVSIGGLQKVAVVVTGVWAVNLEVPNSGNTTSIDLVYMTEAQQSGIESHYSHEILPTPTIVHIVGLGLADTVWHDIYAITQLFDRLVV